MLVILFIFCVTSVIAFFDLVLWILFFTMVSSIVFGVIFHAEIVDKIVSRRKENVIIDVNYNVRFARLDEDVSNSMWRCPVCGFDCERLCLQTSRVSISSFKELIVRHLILKHDATGEFPIFKVKV